MSRHNERDNDSTAEKPNHVVKAMYLEINTIAQGLNIGLIVLIVANTNFYTSAIKNHFSSPIFAVTNLLVSIVFWTRYYFDTEILDRSFTLISVIWFFAYIVSQGMSISFITSPNLWLLSTGIFLLFGSGFYFLNLREIRRKAAARVLSVSPKYVQWQSQRMEELFAISLIALGAAYLVTHYPILSLPAAIISFAISIWQLIITNDYRTLGFIETGI